MYELQRSDGKKHFRFRRLVGIKYDGNEAHWEVTKIFHTCIKNLLKHIQHGITEDLV